MNYYIADELVKNFDQILKELKYRNMHTGNGEVEVKEARKGDHGERGRCSFRRPVRGWKLGTNLLEDNLASCLTIKWNKSKSSSVSPTCSYLFPFPVAGLLATKRITHLTFFFFLLLSFFFISSPPLKPR